MSDIVQGKTPKYTVFFFLLLFLSLASGAIVFIATVNGPSGYSDSVAYIVSARNLIKGLGLGMFTPGGRFVITYLHPPLYPLLLTGIGIWGIDLVDAARWCNIVISTFTVFTTGYIFLRYSRYPELAVIASVLIVFFPTILTMFASAMSETLFLFLLSLSCFMLLNYLQRQTTTSFLVSSLVCGLLPVTRYVGAAIIISAVVCIYLFSMGHWRERLKKSVLFGILASLPLIIWFTVLYLGPGRALGGRSIQIDAGQLMAGIDSYRATAVEILWSWIPFSQRNLFRFFYPFRGTAMIAVFLALSVITWMAGRFVIKDNADNEQSDLHISTFFGIATVSYFFVFMATWLFTVPQTPINDRLLMPIYFTAIPGFLGCLAVWQKAGWSRVNPFLRLLPWILMLLMAYWYYPQVTDAIDQSVKNNTVLAYHWKDSQIIQALKDLPASQMVISNKSETVMMWADRPAYDLMENLPSGFMKQNSPYGSDDTDAAQQAFRSGAVLVIFNDFTIQFESTYGDRGKERLATIFDGLTVVGQYSNGIIYKYPFR